MAKQSSTYHITGTIDNLCFYKMEGKYYVRRKSSLTGKRVKKDAAFEQTMYYANLLGKASTIASCFYKTIPTVDRVKGLYRRLTGMVIQLLKAGKDEEAILTCLHAYLHPKPAVAIEHSTAVAFRNRAVDHFPDALLEVIFAAPVSYRKNTIPQQLKNYGFV